MIVLCKPEDCVGCNACTQICPKKCISMKEDHEGFLYPQIDKVLCIDCHLCEKVCPVIHQDSERKPLAVYAAKNKNEQIRKESSSGGIFTLLAEQIIDEGGVVFGARFDENWDVIHDYTETKEGLKSFRGSKYVQSRIGNTFVQAKAFLKAGRKVLYSGTPCQIAGLKRFIRKDYENLLAVDFVCHGVPSPKVWRLYRQSLLDEVDKNSVLAPDKSCFVDIQFRSKKSGWRKYSFVTTIRKADQNTVSLVEIHSANIYMKGFLHDLYLRPSCHVCPVKNFKSGSDLTIADFWGIQNHYPTFDDNLGISLVFINTIIGDENYSENSKSQIIVSSFEKAFIGNPCISISSKPNQYRMQFFRKLDRKKIKYLIVNYTNQSLKTKIFQYIYGYASRIKLISLVNKFK